ncbi:MAG: DUF3450 domain-containing protein [Gammaproteobacteria bacterium]|nr:DUF3450 domain-containing protein [Gammaproteobacteria bacterium]
MKRQLKVLICVSILFPAVVTSTTAGAADTLKKTMELRLEGQQENRQTQHRVDQLSAKTTALQEEYRQVLDQIDGVRTRNAGLERLIASQRLKLESPDRQLENLGQIRMGLVPMMWRMVDVLEQFIARDLPFLAAERTDRIQRLKKMMDDPAISVPEKYRRVTEAYRIESEYGRAIEAYHQVLELDGQTLSVEILRIGRVGLYYVTSDSSRAGYWNSDGHRWHELDQAFIPNLVQGIRVARNQLPTDLMTLPIAVPVP